MSAPPPVAGATDLPRRSLVARLVTSEALFLVASKLGYKVFLLVFMLILARHLTKEDFGDFQFVSGAVNLLAQPAVLFSMIAVKVGYAFPAVSRRENLRWLLGRRPWLLVVAAVLFVALAAMLDPHVAAWMNLEHAHSLTIASGIVVATVLFNYFIGYLQALDRFRTIGSAFLLMGLATVVCGALVKVLDLDVRYAYAAQATANGATVLLVIGALLRFLPRRGAEPADANLHVLGRFSVKMLLILLAFFGMLNLDIFVTKATFDRELAGWYLRHEFIAKLCFVTASALAVLIFPRTLQDAESGRNPATELKRSSLLFLGLCGAMIATVLLVPKQIFWIIFRDRDMNTDMTLLPLLLCTRLVQSYLFMLITFAGAHASRGLVAAVIVTFGAELAAMQLWHGDVRQIATVALGSAVVGVVLTLFYIVRRGRRGTPA